MYSVRLQRRYNVIILHPCDRSMLDNHTDFANKVGIDVAVGSGNMVKIINHKTQISAFKINFIIARALL